MAQTTTNRGRCLCGATLDKSGLCPCEEHLMLHGTMVNYVDGGARLSRAPKKSRDGGTPIATRFNRIKPPYED